MTDCVGLSRLLCVLNYLLLFLCKTVIAQFVVITLNFSMTIWINH